MRMAHLFSSQDLLLMMGTEILNIDASWAEKLTKTESAILIRAKCMGRKPKVMIKTRIIFIVILWT